MIHRFKQNKKLPTYHIRESTVSCWDSNDRDLIVSTGVGNRDGCMHAGVGVGGHHSVHTLWQQTITHIQSWSNGITIHHDRCSIKLHWRSKQWVCSKSAVESFHFSFEMELMTLWAQWGSNCQSFGTLSTSVSKEAKEHCHDTKLKQNTIHSCWFSSEIPHHIWFFWALLLLIAFCLFKRQLAPEAKAKNQQMSVRNVKKKQRRRHLKNTVLNNKPRQEQKRFLCISLSLSLSLSLSHPLHSILHTSYHLLFCSEYI